VQQKSQVFDLAFFMAIALPAQRSLRGTHLLIALCKDSMAHRVQSGSTIPPGGLPRALLTDVEVTQKYLSSAGNIFWRYCFSSYNETTLSFTTQKRKESAC